MCVVIFNFSFQCNVLFWYCFPEFSIFGISFFRISYFKDFNLFFGIFDFFSRCLILQTFLSFWILVVCVCFLIQKNKRKRFNFLFFWFFLFVLEVLFLEITILNFRSPYFGDFIFFEFFEFKKFKKFKKKGMYFFLNFLNFWNFWGPNLGDFIFFLNFLNSKNSKKKCL